MGVEAHVPGQRIVRKIVAGNNHSSEVDLEGVIDLVAVDKSWVDTMGDLQDEVIDGETRTPPQKIKEDLKRFSDMEKSDELGLT